MLPEGTLHEMRRWQTTRPPPYHNTGSVWHLNNLLIFMWSFTIICYLWLSLINVGNGLSVHKRMGVNVNHLLKILPCFSRYWHRGATLRQTELICATRRPTTISRAMFSVGVAALWCVFDYDQVCIFGVSWSDYWNVMKPHVCLCSEEII